MMHLTCKSMGRQHKCKTFLEICFWMWKLRRSKLIWKYILKLFLVKWVFCYIMNCSQWYLTLLHHVSFQWDSVTELPSNCNLIRVSVIKTKCLPVYWPARLKLSTFRNTSSKLSLELVCNNLEYNKIFHI